MWGGAVPVSAPGSDKCCEGSVLLRGKGEAVISVPIVEHCFALLLRDGGGQVPRVDCVVCLTRAVSVERAIVDSAPGGTIMFGGEDHAGLPPGWGVEGNALQDSQLDISFQSSTDRLLPVEGHRRWDVAGHRFG